MSQFKSLKEGKEYIANALCDISQLERELCQTYGHRKGGGAWEGVSYCSTCMAQIANNRFGKRYAPKAPDENEESTL